MHNTISAGSSVQFSALSIGGPRPDKEALGCSIAIDPASKTHMHMPFSFRSQAPTMAQILRPSTRPDVLPAEMPAEIPAGIC